MMLNNDIEHESDRSYLYLAAIYSIHLILLNVVFLQQNSDVANASLAVRASPVVDCLDDKSNVSGEPEEEYDLPSGANSSKCSNALPFYEKEPNVIFESCNEDYSIQSSRDNFLQLICVGVEEYVFEMAKASGGLLFDNEAVNAIRTIIENLSPAALGIVSGCLVFLLTSAEKD